MKKYLARFKEPRYILGLYALIGLIAGIQRYSLGPASYNNFIIFQHAVYHFFGHSNPYLEYPKEYFDVFLYNPTFIVLFIPFALPVGHLGVILWCLFTPVIYFLGINTLPFPQKSKVFLCYLILPELLTSLANMQTNPLIAAFTVLAFTSIEKQQYAKAATCPPLNFFIKGYGAVAGVFFLLKNPKLKTFFYLAVCFMVLGTLPLLFYSWEEFLTLYEQWFVSLRDDYPINTGLSVMGVVRSLLYAEASILFIQLVGVGCFLATLGLFFYRRNYEDLKFQFLAFVLIWMVIFNQAAESPTYIIAATGVFIWYIKSRQTPLDIALFVFFMVLTVLSSSDIFPRYLANTYVRPYSLKALPCIMIWLKIQAQLFFPQFMPLKITDGAES